MKASYDQLKNLFGKRIDDPVVAGFLSSLNKVVIRKPSDGAQYVLAKEYGFALLFKPLTGYQGGRSKALRVLLAIFLYNEGVDKNKKFADLPYGFDFNLSRSELLKKLAKPKLTWVIGEGKVDVSHPDPAFDEWEI